MGPSWLSGGVALLVLLTGVIALLFVFVVWRRGFVRGWQAAREKPPCCLRCGYNLSGLSHCRCPECGAEYRLEQLWRVPMITPPEPLESRLNNGQ